MGGKMSLRVFLKTTPKGKEVYFADGRINGRRIIRSLKTDDLHTAQVRANAIEREALVGRAKPEAVKVTLGELETEVCEYIRIGMDPNTFKTYRNGFASLLGTLSKQIQITTITRRAVDQWRRYASNAQANIRQHLCQSNQIVLESGTKVESG
jgi:hypothetical protein